jgi:hypothetical protein
LNRPRARVNYVFSPLVFGAMQTYMVSGVFAFSAYKAVTLLAISTHANMSVKDTELINFSFLLAKIKNFSLVVGTSHVSVRSLEYLHIRNIKMRHKCFNSVYT